MVNDEPNGFIRPTHGIRQRDPLSPYIFIMCMKALSNALFMTNQQLKLGIGIKLHPGMDHVPSLLFAYDCLMFCISQGNWLTTTNPHLPYKKCYIIT